MQPTVIPNRTNLTGDVRTFPNRSTWLNSSRDNSVDVYIVLTEINRQKAQLLTPVIVFSVLMMVVGVVGNPLALYIYGWRWQNSTTRIFLFWLAVVDLINCLVTMPTEIYIMTHFFYFPNAEVCRISRFITYVINNSSAVVFVAIAIDRYIRICHPHRKTISVSGAKLACGLSSVIGVGVSWPALLLYGRKKVPIKHLGFNFSFSGVLCEVKNDMDSTPYPLGYFIYLWCGFSSCFLILFVLYAMIGRVMWRRSKRKSFRARVQVSYRVPTTYEGQAVLESTCELSTCNEVNGEISGLTNSFNCAKLSCKRTKIAPPKSTLMLFAITALFVIAFLPFLIVTTIRQHIGPLFYPSLSPGQQVFVNLLSRSYLANNCTNPIVYGLCNSRFRTQLRNVFRISKKNKLSEQVVARLSQS